MDNHKTINTLAELREEQKRIKLESEITKRELAHSFGVVRSDLREYVVKKILVPVGAAGLTAYGVKKLAESDDDKSKKRYRSSSQSTNDAGHWKSLIQMAVSVVTTYFGAKAVTKNEVKEEVKEDIVHDRIPQQPVANGL